MEWHSKRTEPCHNVGGRERSQDFSDDCWLSAGEIALVHLDVRHIAPRAAAHQNLRARFRGGIEKDDGAGRVEAAGKDCRRKAGRARTHNRNVEVPIVQVRRQRESRAADCGGGADSSTAAILCGGSPPSVLLETLMEFNPAIMDLFRRGETLDARNPGRIRDLDFVTRPIRLGSHFALNRLIAALEEVEHAGRLLHG
jgi:hypothetical protein